MKKMKKIHQAPLPYKSLTASKCDFLDMTDLHSFLVLSFTTFFFSPRQPPSCYTLVTIQNPASWPHIGTTFYEVARGNALNARFAPDSRDNFNTYEVFLSLSYQFLTLFCICPRALQKSTITFINAFGSSRGFLDWCLLCLKALLILHVANRAALEKVSNPSSFCFVLTSLCHHDIWVFNCTTFPAGAVTQNKRLRGKVECQMCHEKDVCFFLLKLNTKVIDTFELVFHIFYQ